MKEFVSLFHSLYLCPVVQKITATILLIAFLGQTFNQGFYYVDYLVNKASYMEKCINKARPNLHCNGQCLLMKKIEEQEKRERQQAPEMKLAGKTEVLSSRSSFQLTINSFIADNTRSYILADAGTPVDQPSSFFHPPGA